MTDLSDYSTEEIMLELDNRDRDVSKDIMDKEALWLALDHCRWGNIGLCAHYLIRAIPELHPLGKILGA